VESPSYKHLFFDLDHTLWDFDRNAELTLRELYAEYDFDRKGFPGPELFVAQYKRINDEAWSAYRNGELTKEVLRVSRFRKTLAYFNLSDHTLADELGTKYIDRCPHQPHLIPGTISLLNALKGRYKLHIITNGFSEVQPIKMRVGGLESYFEQVITSEEVGVRKPNAKVFQYALAKTGAAAHESVMIGDSLEADVRGALAVGMDAIWLDLHGAETAVGIDRVSSLAELQQRF